MSNFDEWWFGYKRCNFNEHRSILLLMKDAFVAGVDFSTSIHEERPQGTKEGEQLPTTPQGQNAQSSTSPVS
jgi:hypothetical protein